jgi:hypothetical protein
VCLKDVLQMPERLRQIKVKNKEAIGWRPKAEHGKQLTKMYKYL